MAGKVNRPFDYYYINQWPKVSHGNKSGGISVSSSDRKQALELCMQVLDPFSTRTDHQ